MTTTYAVTFRCDDGRAPGCRIRLVHESDQLHRLDRGRSRAEQAGWLLGLRAQEGGRVAAVDVCPACAVLPRASRRP